MTYEVFTPSAAQWDAFVRAHPRGHVLQLSAWGTHQQADGWRPVQVALRENGSITAGAQLLFKPMARGLVTRGYCPYGPLLTHEQQGSVLMPAIDRIAGQQRAFFLKCESGLFWADDTPLSLAAYGYRPTPRIVQPPRTIVLDLREGEDALLARMNQGTRRKIRQAQKHGIRYFQAAASDVETFITLMSATGERNAFHTHDAAYYRRAYDRLVPQDAALWLAEHEGDVLAGVFVTHVGQTAQYLYGASLAHKRDLMASYGVQWAAVQWAMQRGAQWYDLWGIPDEDEAALEAAFQSRSDGLWGVYGFKRGWGGQVMRSAAAWDKVYSAPLYAAFEALLRWRERNTVNHKQAVARD